MRIGVVGAGAVGGCLAALLGDAGHDVSVVARSSAQAIAANGIRLTGAFGVHATHPRVVDALDAGVDAAIVTTKTHDTRTALGPSSAALAGVPVLAVQNGLGAESRLAHAIGHDRVAVALTTWAVQSPSAGDVEVTAAGVTIVGGEEREAFAALLRSVLPDVRATTRLPGAQWTKLVINAMNATPAVVGRSVQDCMADPALARVVAHAMHEAARVAVATGVALEPIGPATPETIVSMAASVEGARAFATRLATSFGDVPNLGSTQQSILRGRATEVDDLAGAIARQAASLGLEAPVNAGLVQLVREVERTGAFLPARRAAALVAGR